jgi:uncharacterized protein YecT (DUF1311 family)
MARGTAALAAAAFLATWPPAAAQSEKSARAQEAIDLQSPEYRACMFADDSPLDASRYDCLDREFHRLDTLLTQEYRAALARQPDDGARLRLEGLERKWWRTRFDECKGAAGDLRGSTAAVIVEMCEIDVLADRIVWLRHYRT